MAISTVRSVKYCSLESKRHEKGIYLNTDPDLQESGLASAENFCQGRL